MEADRREFWRNEAIAFLALASIKGVGYWSMHSIACSNIGFRDLLKTATSKEVEKLLGVKLSVSDSDWSIYQLDLWATGVEQARRLTREGIDLIFRGQDKFPPNLVDIPDPPFWLFVQGELSNLHRKSVAVVGTRKPTEDGVFLAKYLIATLANSRYPTISGIAMGIDQVVHSESLRYGVPTVAVLGTGIDENHPKGSAAIRAEILSHGGTIVSEYLLKQSYSADNFVRRNRIQAALCDTLFPVEWQIKSGTAHTVEFAARYGKKIINLYLPGTYDLRPELAFAEGAYRAVSFEAPIMTQSMLTYLDSDSLPIQICECQQSLDLEGSNDVQD